MVVSAQFRLGGFYARVTRRIAAAPVRPPVLLALLMAVAGRSRRFWPTTSFAWRSPRCWSRDASAALNHPSVSAGPRVRGQRRVGRDPDRKPPEHAHRPDAPHGLCRLPAHCAAGRAGACGGVVGHPPVRGRWASDDARAGGRSPAVQPLADHKGAIIMAVTGLFLFSPFPREVVALAAAVLLTSRRMASRDPRAGGLAPAGPLRRPVRGEPRPARPARMLAGALRRGVDLGDLRGSSPPPSSSRTSSRTSPRPCCFYRRRPTRWRGPCWRFQARSPATCSSSAASPTSSSWNRRRPSACASAGASTPASASRSRS